MNIIAIDTETALISVGNLSPDLACLSFATEDSAGLFPHNEVEPIIREMLENPDILLVGHNIAYDMAVLMRAFPHLAEDVWNKYNDGKVTDTMLREQLTHIAAGVYRGYDGEDGFIKVEYSLESLAKRHLGKQLDKNTWRLKYGELRQTPYSEWPQGAKDYPVVDAQSTYAIFQAQERNAPYLKDQFRQARAAFWLHLCSVWGIVTDPEAVTALEILWREDFENIKAFLIQQGFVRPDGSRNTALAKARMLSVFPDAPKTATGDVSIARQACLDSGDEILLKYADYSGYAKKFSTDLPMLRKGVVQSRYNTLADSGRTTSEKPNIQNLPRKPGVRECFVPRPGHVFAVCDYSGFELHTWAQACIDLVGASRMAEALNAGRDPHADVAALLGFPVGSDGFKDARQVGKVANFGFPGGLGVNGFRAYALSGYGLHLDEETCQRARRAWCDAWPEHSQYFDVVGRLAQKGPIAQLRSGRVRGDCTFCQACNTFFQGLAADAAKAAGWEIARRCYGDIPDTALLGSRIVAFIHDEFILEVPEEVGHEAAMELSKVMVETANLWTPDVPNKAEALLSRRWSKLAKPTHKDGRLVPWEIG